jgi:hypothetical protein
MEKEISGKNTKTEILEAYEELLARIKAEKQADRQTEKKKTEEKEIVKTVSENSIEKIVKNTANIKFEIVKSFDSLEEKLIAEHKKLTELQQAINIETKNLEEIFQIKINADSLAALLLAQKEKSRNFEAEITRKQAEFDAEMTQKRVKWEREQQDFEQAKHEKEEQLKKERKREDEEYSYNLQLKRKKDNDAYETRKAELEKELTEKQARIEKELAEREININQKEKEFAELKSMVDSFPGRLEKAVKEAENAVRESLELKYRHETDIAAKELEGERKLNEQIISTLKAKIKEQDEIIKQSTQKANEAGIQVRDIALKAIEGASGHRVLSGRYYEGSEAAKG